MNRHTAESSSAHRGTFCPFQHSKGNLDLLTCIGTYLGLFDTYRGTSGVLSIYRGISKGPQQEEPWGLSGIHGDLSGSNGHPQGHICIYLVPTGACLGLPHAYLGTWGLPDARRGISGSGRHSHEHMWVCLVPSEHI